MHHIKHMLFPGLTLLFPAAALAQTAVMFVDGGYAEMCADAAASIGTPGSQIALTGSRLDVAPLELCNRAIAESGILTDLAASHNNRGVLQFFYKHYAEALTDFEQTTTLQPELAAAQINKAYTLFVMQRVADSLIAFDKGIALGPPNAAKAYYYRGVAHEQAGHVREAYYDYLKASELAPEWADPKQELTRFKVNRK